MWARRTSVSAIFVFLTLSNPNANRALILTFVRLSIVSSKRTLYSLSLLYLDGMRLCFDIVCLELFLLHERRLRLFSGVGPIGSGHDGALHCDSAVCVEHDDECNLWNHDGCWNH